LDSLRRQFAEILIVNHHSQRQKTGTQASYCFQIKQHVRRGLALIYGQFSPNRIDYSVGTLDMTGSSATTADGVAPMWGGIKLGVKTDYAINSTEGDSDTTTDSLKRAGG